MCSSALLLESSAPESLGAQIGGSRVTGRVQSLLYHYRLCSVLTYPFFLQKLCTSSSLVCVASQAPSGAICESSSYIYIYIFLTECLNIWSSLDQDASKILHTFVNVARIRDGSRLSVIMERYQQHLSTIRNESSTVPVLWNELVWIGWHCSRACTVTNCHWNYDVCSSSNNTHHNNTMLNMMIQSPQFLSALVDTELQRFWFLSRARDFRHFWTRFSIRLQRELSFESGTPGTKFLAFC